MATKQTHKKSVKINLVCKIRRKAIVSVFPIYGLVFCQRPTDIFYTKGKQSVYSSQPDNSFAIKSISDSRIARISLSYRFGNQRVKSPEKRNGAEAEENRLNKK